MAKTTKRINGDYDIITNAGNGTLTINGNLTVTGTTTSVETTDTQISDNIIILNSGETGAGVTLGESGIEVARGTEVPAFIKWNETDDDFKVMLGFSLHHMSGATPTASDHYTTKQYVDNAVGSSNIDKISEGDTKAEVFDDGGSNPSRFFVEVDGTEVLEQTASAFSTANIQISGNTISNTAVSQDLTFETTGGSGDFYIKGGDVIKIQNRSTNPTAVASHTKVYTKTPAGGGSGVFVANQDTTDELVTKSKAIVFGLIF